MSSTTVGTQPQASTYQDDVEFEEFAEEGTTHNILIIFIDWNEFAESKLEIAQWENDWDDEVLDEAFVRHVR